MNEGIFRLSTEDVAWLALTETVQAFRQLLWAGATARSIAKTVIDVLGSLTVRAHVALQDLTPDIQIIRIREALRKRLGTSSA